MSDEPMRDVESYCDHPPPRRQYVKFPKKREEQLPRAKRLVVFALETARGESGELEPLERWVFEQAIRAVEALR